MACLKLSKIHYPLEIDNMEKCICGKKAKLGRKKMGSDLYYFYYHCPCGESTFSTRKVEFCTELWDSSMKRKKAK